MILEENIWPDRLLEWSAEFDWRAKMRKYFQIMLRLGIELMRGIAQGLGLSPDFFDDKFNDSISTLRLLHYPDPPEENKISPSSSSSSPLALSVDAGGANCQLDSSLLRLSCSQHTDSGILTLLWQDSVGGLQAQNGAGQWVPVTPTEGALVINIGDLLQRWTNGRFVATVHRV
jgi:isopenicillin N synthase-like dioxygenase